MSDQTPLPLAARWLRDASKDPSKDLALLAVVDRCRSDSTLNEAELLRALLGYADAIASGDVTMPGEGAGAEDA